jgi:hypothetical protein
MTDETRECERILDAFRPFGPVLAIKLYRIALPDRGVPLLPCLDHEAMLHGGIPPHVAAYVQETASGDLHEIVFVPKTRRAEIDSMSTSGECSAESRARLRALLARTLPEYAVHVTRPSWWRGDRRVAAACAGQIALRDVLLAPTTKALDARVDRLRTIGTLMEKESRVASWGVRTVTGPLLAAAGVITFYALGGFEALIGAGAVTGLRTLLVGLLGAAFLYYGLKAVQLTGMANRVWKRAAEYSLILEERRRLQQARPETPSAMR